MDALLRASRALTALHPFASRSFLRILRKKSLYAHVWALANVRKTGYASISVFAAACSLFNQIYASSRSDIILCIRDPPDLPYAPSGSIE